jgi:hypothetical protein
MSKISDHLYTKIEKVASTVKEDLRKKGIVIPIKNKNGSITIDRFTIIKEKTGFYVIKDQRNEVVVQGINLPQTAALLANGLALGKWIDTDLYNVDQSYGYKLFETELFQKSAGISLKNNNIDRAELMFTKATIASSKVEQFKKQIINSFEKLRRLH